MVSELFHEWVYFEEEYNKRLIPVKNFINV